MSYLRKAQFIVVTAVIIGSANDLWGRHASGFAGGIAVFAYLAIRELSQ